MTELQRLLLQRGSSSQKHNKRNFILYLESSNIDLVKGLLQRHQEYTDSTVAENILKNWPDAAASFVKVMPTEYRRVLDEQAAERNASEELVIPNG